MGRQARGKGVSGQGGKHVLIIRNNHRHRGNQGPPVTDLFNAIKYMSLGSLVLQYEHMRLVYPGAQV